ncbi:MAG: hypothetical protein WBG73_11860 [Coleofasciculaceae cyanobacterium]
MLKLVQKIAHIALFSVGAFAALLIFSSAAWASESSKALSFDASTSAVEVVTIYETSFSTQKSLVTALKSSSKLLKKAPGFAGFSMLRSQDRKQMITLSQWQDLSSYKAYNTPIVDSSLSASKQPTSTPTPTHIKIFELTKAQASIANAIPAFRGKEAVVQFIKLMPNSADDQGKLLEQIEVIIPDLLQKQPIPQSALLFKGIDNNEIILMLNWNCSVMFEDLGKPSAIAFDDNLVLSDIDQQFYDVIKIMPAEVKETRDED